MLSLSPPFISNLHLIYLILSICLLLSIFSHSCDLTRCDLSNVLIFNIKWFRNRRTYLERKSIIISTLFPRLRDDERASGNDGPPRSARTPAGRSEWARGPIDLTRNEITSSFSSRRWYFSKSRGTNVRHASENPVGQLHGMHVTALIFLFDI